MNKKKVIVDTYIESDKESDEPEPQDDRQNEENAFNIDDEHEHVYSKGSGSPIGISLSDIIGDKDDGDDYEEEEENQPDLGDSERNYEIRERNGKRNSDKNWAIRVLMKAIVYGIILIGWGLVNFYFNMPLKKGSFEATSCEIFTAFFTLMSIITYYRCCSVSCVNPTQRIPDTVDPSNANTCNFCQKWKPERTHHCSNCGLCILRMDHHCKWTQNCVGYRNHKAFLLFCFYTGVASLYFDYRAFDFFMWVTMDHGVFNLSAYFLIFSLVCTFIILPVGMLMMGLFGFHLLLAMNNLTTIEALSGKKITIPFKIKMWTVTKPINGSKLNQYDKGMLANLKEFFGSFYLFWWPTVPPYAYEGQHFPQPIDLASKEVKKQPQSIKEINLEALLREADEYTKDRQIQFDHSKLNTILNQKERESSASASVRSSYDRKLQMKEPFVPRKHEAEEILNSSREDETASSGSVPIFRKEGKMMRQRSLGNVRGGDGGRGRESNFARERSLGTLKKLKEA